MCTDCSSDSFLNTGSSGAFVSDADGAHSSDGMWVRAEWSDESAEI